MNTVQAWTKNGLLQAIKLLLKEPNTLFDDMTKKLLDHPALKDMLQKILFDGIDFPFKRENPIIDLGVTFGFLKDKNGIVAVANRIFETQLYDTFLSEMAVNDRYIIELKIWHGNEYNLRGQKQLFDYLDYYKEDKGYLLSFNFNKNKKTGVNELEYDGRKIMEVVV